MRHHDLDMKPNPEKVLYVNERWIGDIATNTGIKEVPAFPEWKL